MFSSPPPPPHLTRPLDLLPIKVDASGIIYSKSARDVMITMTVKIKHKILSRTAATSRLSSRALGLDIFKPVNNTKLWKYDQSI